MSFNPNTTILNGISIFLGDNLHEVSKSIFWENKKKCFKMLTAEFAQKVVKDFC